MSEWFDQLANNKHLLSAAAGIAGYILATVVAAIKGKMARLEYTVRYNRIGMSATDPIFGSVEVRWQGEVVPNVFTSRLELVNTTTADLTDLKLKIYPGANCSLLSEKTRVLDTPYIVEWSPEYRAQLAVPQGQEPTAAQREIYRTNREYTIPVLNRGQKLVFEYIATAQQGQVPSVWASTMHKGAETRWVQNFEMTMGVPVPIAALTGIVFSVVVLLLFSFFVDSVAIAALVCMLVGLTAQPIGAVIVRSYRAVRRAMYH